MFKQREVRLETDRMRTTQTRSSKSSSTTGNKVNKMIQN